MGELTSELSNIHIVFDSIDNRKQFEVTYVPGDLIISDLVWTKINSDTTSNFFLKFDYYTYTNNAQKITNFFVELTRFELKQPYLILNIYDFRNKKYKHWYKWLTDKEFLSEFRFPNSGIYIRKR